MLGTDSYILFDCPGQVELFTHHTTLPNLFHRLEKAGYRVRLYSLPSPPFCASQS